MKKVLFGIFAHPDDEAFGPSGTLYKMANQRGYDVHLICATGGESGVNSEHHKNLGKIRLNEWREAGSLIGATSQNHLGYFDGELSNSKFHDIAQAIEACVRAHLHDYGSEELEVSFMTFDLNGLSGHIDHVVMSMVASYVYYRAKLESTDRCTYKELRYFCLNKADIPEVNVDYVFMPAGRDPKEIDIVEDITDVPEQKHAIMCAHYSQRHDAEKLLQSDFMLKREHFYLAK